MTSKVVSIAFFILISLTVLTSLGCTEEIHTNLVQHHFEVGEQSFTISLPSEFLRHPETSVVQFLRPNYRVERLLQFTSSLPTLDSSYYKTNLRQGGELRYQITTYANGSGGIEAELSGHIILDTSRIGVTATDQDEISPTPEWCIEFLHTLRSQ